MQTLKKTSFVDSKNFKDGIFFALMVLIPTLNFIVMYLCVNINSILLAFKQYDVSSATFKFAGFSNFEKFILEFKTTTVFTTSIKNSLIAAIFSIGVNTTLTIVFALYIYHKRFAHNFFKIILFAPSIISSIVLVKVFAMFSDEAIPNILVSVFNVEIKGLLADVNTRWSMIIFYNIWSGFGASLLVYVGSMNNISESVSEAAKLDGANIIQETMHVTIPLVYPTIVTYITAGMATLLTNQLSLYSFYGNAADSNLYTVGYWLYKEVKDAGGNIAEFPYIASVGILCTVFSVPVVYLVRYLMNKFGPSVE